MNWELQAFIKLARVGAIVFLPLPDGKFLMQRNGDNDRHAGKLRPPGGGKERQDKGHFDTIIRELHEEFNLDPLIVKKKLKFLGFEYRKPFWGSAVFELKNHGLKPGIYQASNDPDEKVELVIADLDHDDYNGPKPHKLLSDAAKEKGDELMKSAVIKEEGGQFVLYTHDGSKVIGSHPSREKALAQERAIQASKHADCYTEDPSENSMVQFMDAANKSGSAVGIPDREDYGDITQLPLNTELPFVVQKHTARKSGEHFDIRLGDKQLHSWATRKGLPAPGQKHMFFEQPLHDASYADFQGDIPEGYGAGTVKTHEKGHAIVTRAEPGHLSFMLTHRKYPEHISLIRQADKKWLAVNTTPTDAEKFLGSADAFQKPHMKLVDSIDPKTHLVSAKLSGASNLFKLNPDSVDVMSYRKSKKDNRPIIHSHRFFGSNQPKLNIPPELAGTVLRGELYGTQDGKAISETALGGLLNSSIHKSLASQKERNIKLKSAVFDIVGFQGTPQERRARIQAILKHLPADKFEEPPYAETPEDAVKMTEDIRTGKHPLTEEGEVGWPLAGGPPVKRKNFHEADVYFRGFAPGKNRLEDKGAGAIKYSVTPDGPVVGEVGSGLDDLLRQDIMENPDEYMGRVLKIRHRGQGESGAYFQPVLLAPHEDYQPSEKSASAEEGTSAGPGQGKVAEVGGPGDAKVAKIEKPLEPPLKMTEYQLDDSSAMRDGLKAFDENNSFHPNNMLLAREKIPFALKHNVDLTLDDLGRSADISKRLRRLRYRRGEVDEAVTKTAQFLLHNVENTHENFQPVELITPVDEFESWAKSAGLHIPENWDDDDDLSTKSFTVRSGANDWEQTTSAVAIDFGYDVDHTRRIWAHLDIPKHILDGANWDRDYGKNIIKRWIKLADEQRHIRADKDLPHPSWRLDDFKITAPEMGFKDWGVSRMDWKDMDKSASAISNTTTDATSDMADNQSIPTTGPAAIAYALNNIDLEKEETDAKAVVKRGLKTKRPLAVKKLGFIQGFKRSGLHPRDLMISRVPVIPPQFRPFSVAGDVFIPGDANELYRDLINITDVHKDLEKNLGPAGAASNKLRIYDAMRAVYGFGDPTSPKTKERGVSGFLKKVTGTNPKLGYVSKRLISHNQDYVGRGVIGVDPDLGLDEIGIPEEMAWKLYAPYIQRRLVRNGMPMETAVKEIRDRTDQARNMMLAETKERPVMYSRSPAWHRFSVIGGYPKVIGGSTININSLVGTGLGADHDGDTINIHLPSMHEAVDDVKNKLLPSKMLWSIKESDKVVPVPKHEMILGLASAQQRPAKRSHTFPNEQAALAAIKRGDVAMSDDVQIA